MLIYWVVMVGILLVDDGFVMCDFDVDVVIIGVGYMGFVIVLCFVWDYGIKVVVFEVNCISWGCSSCNGG